MRMQALVPLAFALSAPSLFAAASFADGHFSLDGLVRGQAVYWRFTNRDGSTSKFEFQKGTSQLGLTGSASDVVSGRLLLDVANLQLLDLHADLLWPGGVSLRAGQFKLPLSFEIAAGPADSKLDNSLAYGLVKRAGMRDIGAMLGYRPSSRLEGFMAAVNGSGANSGDWDRWKDLVARVIYRPAVGLDLGAGAYYGRYDSAGVLWLAVLGDAKVERGPLAGVLQGLWRRDRDSSATSAMVQLSYDLGWVEPVGRFDVLLVQGKQLEVMPVVGLNFRPLRNGARILVDYQYHKLVGSWLYDQLSLRVEASF